jgi:GGDEF domain-containing protein
VAGLLIGGFLLLAFCLPVPGSLALTRPVPGSGAAPGQRRSLLAERVRTMIENLDVPRPDSEASIRVAASEGGAALADGGKDQLIEAADDALCLAGHQGKNRTVRAEPHTANVVGDE